jgi:hypothetical protein
MKITKSELKQIIKEEALKFKKKLQLESQLAEVEKELEEVTAGDMHELPDGTKKWKPEFEELSKDGGYPALKEEEACEEGETVEKETVEEGIEDEIGVEETIEETVEEGEAVEEQTLEEMLAEIMAEEDVEACEENEGIEENEGVEEGEEPLNEVAVLAVLAGIGALVGGSIGLAALEMKAEEAAEGKIEDKPIYKAFRKVQKAATGLSEIKKGNVYEGEEIELEKAAEVAEENPEAPEAKEMAAAMKDLEAAAKAMSDEDKAELKAECAAMEESMACEEEVVSESIDNSKSVLTEEQNRMKQLAGLL